VKFILRKYVEADTPLAALAMDEKTPVHDVYLREGEEPKSGGAPKDLIGFMHPEEPSFGYADELNRKKSR
jgi:hypothetical protein